MGEHIFNNLLAQNSKNLTQAAKILATDYGFREAVSSKDTETIVSALENYRGRIGATIALFHDASGQYVTGTANEDRQDADKSIALLIKNAEGQGSVAGIVVMDNLPYQLVILPVKAPLLVGWVTMGFAVDDELANSVHSLSALDVTFLIKTADGKLIPVATTLDKSDAAHLSQISQDALNNGLTSTEIKLSKTLYSTRYVKLSEQGIGNENIVIALQRSLNEALAPYKTLQFNLLFIAILGSLIFIAVGIYIAQRITKPLDAFAKIAEKYGHGDYSTPAKIKGKDELARLGTALNNMRDAIAKREKKITKLAYQDELTGLPNRAALTEIAEKHTKHMSSEMRGITVILLDVDRFKEINTVLGKIDADEVLKIVAERIKAACYKSTDVVARYSGDKFAILLPKVTADIALSTAERILKSFELPAIVNEHSVDLAARMGVATYLNHANTIEALFGSAELAMYEAKRLQTNAVIYSNKLDVSKEQSLSFSTEIKEALEQNQFKFYVQPKLNLRTNKIVAVEALIRWLNPQQELLSPDKFIPQAEKAGHIAKISLWMLINAATHYAKWQSYGINISIAVNLSARDLMDVDLPDKIAKILSDRQIPPKAIALEITESSIMEDPEQARITVARLSKYGPKNIY